MLNIFKHFHRFYKAADDTWKVDKVIDVPSKKVSKDGVESELDGKLFFVLVHNVYDNAYKRKCCLFIKQINCNT